MVNSVNIKSLRYQISEAFDVLGKDVRFLMNGLLFLSASYLGGTA